MKVSSMLIKQFHNVDDNMNVIERSNKYFE